jgi:hypothetical protein
MSDNIMGQRFIARSKPAWHNIAKRIFDENEVITARQAMAEVAGDIEIVKRPLFYTLDGSANIDAGKVAVIRKPTLDSPKPLLLGVAEDSWVADSYAELAGTIDELSRTFKVETAGLLNEGGLAFLCLRGPDYDVKGDEMRNYFAANFSGTPGIGHYILQSDVRVVCWNTNLMSQQKATINLSVPHSADAKMRFSLAAKLVGQFHEMQDKAKGIFTAFADRQVTEKDVDSIIYAAFQLPKLPAKLALIKQQLNETESQVFQRALTPQMLRDLEKEQERWDKQTEGVLALREAAKESFESFNPPHLRGTAWAAYNAVTEVADWREGRNADEGAVLGSRAREKGRAFEAAMALVTK